MCTYLLLTISLVCQFHYIYNIVTEMADALGIKVFKTKPKNEVQDHRQLFQAPFDQEASFDKPGTLNEGGGPLYELKSLNETQEDGV